MRAATLQEQKCNNYHMMERTHTCIPKRRVCWLEMSQRSRDCKYQIKFLVFVKIWSQFRVIDPTLPTLIKSIHILTTDRVSRETQFWGHLSTVPCCLALSLPFRDQDFQ